MPGRYIIRLDDACPVLLRKSWARVESLLDKYNIKPVVAVIPDNKDPKMVLDSPDKEFWDKVRVWVEKGWHIAMHGYDHLYITRCSGIVPMNCQSEFAGVTADLQREKIRSAINIFKREGLEPKIWVAPSHTFDKNTLRILLEETDIRIISDGVSYYPYNKYGFFWIPQQLWAGVVKEFGVWTICLHPNTMDEHNFDSLEQFIKENSKFFINDYKELEKEYGSRRSNLKDKMFYYIFFIRRFLKKTDLYNYYRKLRD